MTDITITISREDASVAQFWLDADAHECVEEVGKPEAPVRDLLKKAGALGRVADALKAELEETR